MNINGYIHDGWFVLRPDYKKVNRDFLYYSLLSDYVQTQFKGTCTGSVVKNIRSELVNDLDIFLPDITEQKRISKVLSTIDRKISVNREINRKFLNFPPIWNLTLQNIIPNHLPARRLVRLAFFIREIKLHKPVVVNLFCQLF